MARGVTLPPYASEPIPESLLVRFDDVDARLLERRQLLRRTDTKFVLRRSMLAELLGDVTPRYGLLSAGDQRLPHYRTLYFDTESLRSFHDHRRGRRPRHKVRIRRYLERGLSFLEVKTKRSERLTIKNRREVPFGGEKLVAADLEFVAAHCDLPAEELRPQVWTNFRRLTLVGFETNERVTIDVDLRFVGASEQSELEAVAILEVKQSPFCVRTPIMQALRARGLRRTSMSKYCTATAVTRRGVRLNRLLPAVRAVLEGSL